MYSEPPYFKRRQMGHEGLVNREMEAHLYELMFGPRRNVQQEILELAMKIAKGATQFTPDELQLQANEPEKLEATLVELRKWLVDGKDLK